MNEITQKAVYELLKNFAHSSLKDFDLDELKKAYPFHRLFFDEVALVAFKKERSISTKMGMHLYPKLAEVIASEKNKDVEREKLIEGFVNNSVASTIDRIVTEIRNNQRSPSHVNEISEIKAEYSKGAEDVKLITRADLYIGDHPNGPFFAEIKTPLPNLDICAETKKKILTFETLLDGQSPKAVMAFAYNPFITRENYSHSFTNKIMDMGVEVQMAEEFWDYIGGPNTWDTILSIIETVGQELRDEKEAAPKRK